VPKSIRPIHKDFGPIGFIPFICHFVEKIPHGMICGITADLGQYIGEGGTPAKPSASKKPYAS
jgi:hypothetical protein